MEGGHSRGIVQGPGRNNPTTTKTRRWSWNPHGFYSRQPPDLAVNRLSLGCPSGQTMASDRKTTGKTEKDTRLDISLRQLRDELVQLRTSGEVLSEQMQVMFRTIQELKDASEEDASWRESRQDLTVLAEENWDLQTECRSRKGIAIPEEFDGLCCDEPSGGVFTSSPMVPAAGAAKSFSCDSELDSCNAASNTVHSRSVSDCSAADSVDSAFSEMSSVLNTPTSPPPLPPRTYPPPVPPRRAYSVPVVSREVTCRNSQAIREGITKVKRRSKCEWMLELDVQTATLV